MRYIPLLMEDQDQIDPVLTITDLANIIDTQTNHAILQLEDAKDGSARYTLFGSGEIYSFDQLKYRILH